MDEGIPVLGIHKKCGRRQLVRYGGGDVTIWCNHCDCQIHDYHKEVAPGLFWLPLLWYWLKRIFKNGGKK